MIRNTRWLATALLVTALNLGVATRSGPALWQLWGNAPLTRFLVLLLAGALCSSLTNVWSHTADLIQPRVSSTYFAVTPVKPQAEGIDV